MKIKGAIFDLDGTLIDSMHIWKDLSEKFLSAKGIIAEDGLNDIIEKLSDYESAKYLNQKYLTNLTLNEVYNEIFEFVVDRYLNDTYLKDGILELLEKFKADGVKMYVATANNKRLAKISLDTHNISDFFLGYITCNELNTNKSDSIIYEKALELIGVEKSETIIFEDVIHAVKTAKKAGFRVCTIYDEYSKKHKAELIEISDYYLDTYKDWCNLK